MSNRVATGVVYVLVAACGVTAAILTAMFMKKTLAHFTDVTTVGVLSKPFWTFQLAFIVPGVIGVIASATKNKCLHILAMVFSITTLVFMGIFFIIGILFIVGASLYTITDSCTDVTVNPAACAVFKSIYAMLIALAVFDVLGWILTLIGTILAGIATCSRQNDHPGTMLQTFPVQYTSYDAQKC